jgi:hypothetical protein
MIDSKEIIAEEGEVSEPARSRYDPALGKMGTGKMLGNLTDLERVGVTFDVWFSEQSSTRAASTTRDGLPERRATSPRGRGRPGLSHRT